MVPELVVKEGFLTEEEINDLKKRKKVSQKIKKKYYENCFSNFRNWLAN